MSRSKGQSAKLETKLARSRWTLTIDFNYGFLDPVLCSSFIVFCLEVFPMIVHLIVWQNSTIYWSKRFCFCLNFSFENWKTVVWNETWHLYYSCSLCAAGSVSTRSYSATICVSSTGRQASLNCTKFSYLPQLGNQAALKSSVALNAYFSFA